jgi:hypothetical protein
MATTDNKLDGIRKRYGNTVFGCVLYICYWDMPDKYRDAVKHAENLIQKYFRPPSNYCNDLIDEKFWMGIRDVINRCGDEVNLLIEEMGLSAFCSAIEKEYGSISPGTMDSVQSLCYINTRASQKMNDFAGKLV